MCDITIIREKSQRARKKHNCDVCGSVILPSEYYIVQTNRLDDVIYNWKQCSYCETLREDAYVYYNDFQNNYCGLTKTMFYDYINELGITFKPRRLEGDL